MCGIATIIGHSEYQALLRENNKFFSSLATIPVVGIEDATLGLDITVPDPKEGNRKMTLREVFQQQDWCIQVEPTQTPGKILFVTTKAQVSIGRRWIDENFDALFRIHLPRNPQFQQSTSIPRRLDKIPTSNSMLDYAKVLCRSISSLPSDPKSDKKYARKPFVPKRGFNLTFDKEEFPALPRTKSKLSRSSSTAQQTISASNSISSEDSHTPSARANPQDNPAVDLSALKAELKAELKQSLLEEFEDMRKELASFKAAIQSLPSPTTSQATSFSGVAAELKAELKGEITALRAELQTVIEELRESMVLLYSKVKNYPSLNPNATPSLQERRDGRS